MWAITCTGKMVVSSVTRSARPAPVKVSIRSCTSRVMTGWSASMARALNTAETSARVRACSFPSISMMVRPKNFPTS